MYISKNNCATYRMILCVQCKSDGNNITNSGTCFGSNDEIIECATNYDEE